MTALIALLNVAFLLLTSLISDGSSRSYIIDKKSGQAPLVVNFNSKDLKDAGLAQKFIWTFGDGETLTTANTSVTHTYKIAGSFTAKLQYLKKSTDSISQAKDGGKVKVVVSAPANASPIAKLECVSKQINKIECNSNGSIDPDGNIISYKYEWGDGQEIIQTSNTTVEHFYSSAGTKNIRLSVLDNKNAIGIVEKNYELKENTPPIANFICENRGVQKIHCESISSDAEESLTQIKWTLDDENIYSTASFDHTFSRLEDISLANHIVNLEVVDSLGLKSSISKSIQVELEPLRQVPRAYFKVFMDGTNVNLRSFITKSQFPIKRAYYNVYGASPDLLQQVELTDFYSNSFTRVNLGAYGGYRINLVVEDIRGQVIQVSRPFTLTENTLTLKPFVDFRLIQSGPKTIYINLSPSFDYDEAHSLKSFNINFGNGHSVVIEASESFLTYTYAQTGNYTISVTATTDHLTTTTTSKSIDISDEAVEPIKPDATFAYKIYGYAQNVGFYNEKSGTANGEIISYHWDFGDGSYGSGANQAHFYNPGTYLVTLTVTDTMGLTNSQTQKVDIQGDGNNIVARINCNYEQPFIDIVQKCKITALDRFNDISRVRVVWGDNTAINLGSADDVSQGTWWVNKKFNADGNYTVRLVVSTNRGESRSHEVNLSLTSRPPKAGIDCYANFLTVDCTAHASYDPKGQPLSYQFDMGNGVVFETSNPNISYKYDIAKEYEIKLIVTDSTGLKDSAIKKIITYSPEPIAIVNCVTNNLMIYCDALASYDPQGNSLSYEFNFGDGQTEVNHSGIVNHSYSSAGLYIVQLKLTNSLGYSSFIQTQVQVVTPSNQNPIANLNCFSDKPFSMICNASQSFDNDGYIVKATYYHDGIKLGSFDPAFSFNYTFQSAGLKSLKLEVNDNDGGVGVFEGQVSVLDNLPPNVEISCSLNYSNYHLNCNSQVSDDNRIVSLKWFINNHDLEISDYSFSRPYSIAGNAKVRLVVTDEYGAITSKEFNLDINENLPPVIQAFCQSNSPQIISCYDISHDPENHPYAVIWTIDGVEYPGHEIQVHVQEGGMKNVSVTATDLLGASRIIVTSVFVEKIVHTLEDIPVAEFSCSQSSGRILDCSAALSRPMNKIARYVWSVNGAQFEGELKSFQIPEQNESIDISLTVYDSHGSSDSSIHTYGVVTLPILSEGILLIKPPENAQLFYSLDEKMQFSISNVNLSENKDKNKISINGTIIDAINVNYIDNDSIEIDRRLIDGKNEISFSLYDEEDNLIKKKFDVYAGDRNIILTLEGALNNTTMLISEPDSATPIGNLSISGASVEIKNVPTIDLLVFANSGSGIGSLVIFPEKSDYDLRLYNFTGSANSQNTDFSNGTDGWEVEGANANVENGSLKLSNHESNIATLRKVLRVKNQDDASIVFDYSLSATRADEYYSITMKNQSTGETIHRIQSTRSAQAMTEIGKRLEQSQGIEVKNPNDKVEVVFSLFKRPSAQSEIEEEVSVIHFFKKLFFQNVIAQTFPVPSYYDALIRPVTFDKIFLNVKLFSRSVNNNNSKKNPLDIYNELEGISVGKYPVYKINNKDQYVYKVPIAQNVYSSSNPIGVQYKSIKGYQPSKVSIELYKEGDDHPFIQKEVSSSYMQPDQNGITKINFDIPSQNHLDWRYFLNDEKNIKIKPIVKIVETNGAIHIFDKFESLTPFVSVSSYNDLFDRGDLPPTKRYSDERDLNLGGDDWVQPQQMSMVTDYFSGLSQDKNVFFDDFSRMNGGNHPDHTGHEIGKDVDVRFTEGNRGFYRYRNTPITDRETAKKLIDILKYNNLYQKVDRLLVTFPTLSTNAFKEEFEMTCFSDGRIGFDDRVQYYKNHKGNTSARGLNGILYVVDEHEDHFHIDFDFSRSVNKNESSYNQYTFTTGVERTDQYGIIKVKNYKYPGSSEFNYLKNTDFYIFGKAQRDSANKKFKTGDWVKLEKGANINEFVFNLNGNEIVPLNEAGKNLIQLMEYKIIFKGNDNTKCAESSPRSAVVNNEQIYRFCNISASTINIQIGDRSVSLYTKRLPLGPNTHQHKNDCACQDVKLPTWKDYNISASATIDSDVDPYGFSIESYSRVGGPKETINYFSVLFDNTRTGVPAVFRIYEPSDDRYSNCINDLNY